jgi:hypothetical protein
MSRRDELLSAALWAVLGAVIVAASWRMDRLEDRGINPWSAPGLTPGLIGLLMIVFALVLGWRARHATARDDDDAAAPAAGAARRTLIAVVLCVLFAGVTLGHGLPFAAEGAVFIFAFTSVYRWPTWRAEHRTVRGLAQTLVIAVAASTFISWLFESVFLVRLP